MALPQVNYRHDTSIARSASSTTLPTFPFLCPPTPLDLSSLPALPLWPLILISTLLHLLHQFTSSIYIWPAQSNAPHRYTGRFPISVYLVALHAALQQRSSPLKCRTWRCRSTTHGEEHWERGHIWKAGVTHIIMIKNFASILSRVRFFLTIVSPCLMYKLK